MVALTVAEFSRPMSTQVLHDGRGGQHAGGRREADQHGRGDRAAVATAAEKMHTAASAVAGDARCTPAGSQSVALRDLVGEKPAEELRGNAERQRQRGDHAQFRLLEAMALVQVGGQPGDAEIERGAVRHVGHAQQQHVAMRMQLAPERPTARMGRLGRPVGDDQRALGFVRGGMRGGLVAKPAMPGDDPDEAHAAERHQDGAPAYVTNSGVTMAVVSAAEA